MGWMQSLTSPRTIHKMHRNVDGYRISHLTANGYTDTQAHTHTSAPLSLCRNKLYSLASIFTHAYWWIYCCCCCCGYIVSLAIYCCVLVLSHANRIKRAKNWRADSPHQWISLSLSVVWISKQFVNIIADLLACIWNQTYSLHSFNDREKTPL